MNDILDEIYGTIIPSAPYIIAAYALVLVALFVYVFIVMRGTRKAEKRLEVLEETLAGQTREDSVSDRQIRGDVSSDRQTHGGSDEIASGE